MNEGESYYFRVGWAEGSSHTGPFTVTLTYKPEIVEPKDIYEDVEEIVSLDDGDRAYFRFVPEESAAYVFSSDSGETGTCGTLYDSDWESLAYKDGYDEGFTMKYSLYTGRTYYFSVEYSYMYCYGSFKVKVKKQEIPATIEIQAGETRTVNIPDDGMVYFKFIPEESGIYVTPIPGFFDGEGVDAN